MRYVLTALSDCPIDGPDVEFEHLDCDACQERAYEAGVTENYDGIQHCPHYECLHCGYRIGD